MIWIFPPFLQGFGLGAGLIVAIGAQNAFVLRQGLQRRHVLEVTMVCFLCDAVLVTLGSFGLGSLIAGSDLLGRLAGAGGALFLLAYGAMAFRSALKPRVLTAEGGAVETRGTAIGAALAFSLLNPHVYLDTVVLLGSIAAQFEPMPRIPFTIGAVSASFVWFVGLGYGASRLAPLFVRPVAWRVLDAAIGLVMWTIALSLAISTMTA